MIGSFARCASTYFVANHLANQNLSNVFTFIWNFAVSRGKTLLHLFSYFVSIGVVNVHSKVILSKNEGIIVIYIDLLIY